MLTCICLRRYVADSGGAFVQPATYEAFGLTVIEVRPSKCSADISFLAVRPSKILC